VVGGVDLLGTARHLALALRAQALDGGEGQHDQGSVRYRAIHHDTPTDLVARESGLALGTTGAAALVELEIDLRSNFLVGHLRNDIPPERGQGLDVTDFHTRSRPSRQGVCHPRFSRKSVMPRRRRACRAGRRGRMRVRPGRNHFYPWKRGKPPHGLSLWRRNVPSPYLPWRAVALRRRALRAMKPVASSWL
jgi:hypothetical protein